MNLLRHHLFAGPLFPQDQNRTVARRCFDNFPEELLHLGAGTHQLAKPDLDRLRRRPAAQSHVNLCLHIVDIQRANQDVVYPLIHQLDHLVDRWRPAHQHDHPNARIDFPRLRKEFGPFQCAFCDDEVGMHLPHQANGLLFTIYRDDHMLAPE